MDRNTKIEELSFTQKEINSIHYKLWMGTIWELLDGAGNIVAYENTKQELINRGAIFLKNNIYMKDFTSV